jgi:uncharacterized protein (TIGR03085 family)
MTVAARERAALVKTMREVGPDAPTLCEGWTARDLAAHLILRERHPIAALGIMIPPLADRTAAAQQRVAAAMDWDRLLQTVAAGPPVYSPFKLIDPLVNTGEMFIHHEDIRRARPDWQPRAVDGPTVAALRRMARLTSRLTLARAPARVTLRDDDGALVGAAGNGPDVEIKGAPTELTLFLSGRDAVRLDFAGAPQDIDAVRNARRPL